MSITTSCVNVGDYERLAEQALEPGPYGYFAGGACDEITLRDNLDAFGRWQLRPRMLVDVSSVSTATTVLGKPVSMPLLVAPTAFQRLCNPAGEPAVARAAAHAGTVFCLSTIATTAPRVVMDEAPEGRKWFQVYVFQDEAITRALVEQAVDAGFEALVLTVDAPGAGGRRERDLRTGFEIPAETGVPSLDAAFGGRAVTVAEAFAAMDASLTWRDLERIAGMSDLPLLVKGILTAEDAALAVEHGADGVIVSNHGGRQLDGVPATLDALPEVVEAVDGAVEILVDGGIRRGTDVVKALALGAKAALAGRALLWGLAGGGEDGARHVLDLLREEITLALRLLGAPSPEAVERAHVQRTP